MNEDLVKRFAPVLLLHPAEKFMPVDAKRYMENANLWRAGMVIDDKTTWDGDATTPFPRQPLAHPGELAGIAGESGKLIDDGSLQPAETGGEMFLELGGWKDGGQMSEPDVTSTSTNQYADRNSIAAKYNALGALFDSQFWYHAELIEGPDLATLQAKAGPPDFSTYLTPNSALLCYYFFFPAHQQSVSKDYCNNVGSQEAACHAGDWQCMAILLEGDGSGQASGYKPTFFGCTGSQPLPTDGSQMYRPNQFDGDGLTVMKVERWRPQTGPAALMPELEPGTEHPRLYVALGTHSLFTRPGTFEVTPFPPGQDSQWCGTYDTPSVAPPDLGDDPDDTLGRSFEDTAAFFAKVLAGSAFGGPFGMIAGALLGAAEGTVPHGAGLGIVGTYDPPDPEQAPSLSNAVAIAPADVTVQGVAMPAKPWKVAQGVLIGDRTYDYLVDRDAQHIWPNDKTGRGYRGRWGQQVTADFLPRRSGPKFPDYLKMFLLARSDGDTRHLYDDL